MQPQSSSGHRLAALAVAVVALGVAAAGLPNRYAQDDVLLIEEHFLLHDLGNWQAILSAPYWPPPHTDALYRPVASLLHAVQYAIGGGSPLAFRMGSAVLYALAAVAVLALARRLLPPILAAAVALLFAAHPVHVEAVALGVGQGEILVTLLLTVAVTRYLDCRRRGDGRLTAGEWLGLGALYLIASLTKEIGIVLPALLLAAEVLLRPGPAGESRKPLVGGYAVLAVAAAAVLLVRTLVLAGEGTTASRADALEGLGLGDRMLTMLPVAGHWLRLLAWPAHLQADYAPQEIVSATSVGPPQLVGIALLAAAAAVLVLAWRRAPVVAFGLAWLAIGLAPVSNLLFVSGIALAERTLFLPSAGWLLAVGGTLALVSARLDDAVRWWRPALVGGVALLVALGVARSVVRFPAWRDDTTYALQAGLDAPRSWRAQLARAEVLYRSGDLAGGAATYERAAELAPRRWVWRVRNDLARRLIETGEVSQAARELEASLSAVPDQEETHHYLVLSYLNLARYDEAALRADSALARGFNPDLFRGLRALADTMARENAPPGSLRINVRRGR